MATITESRPPVQGQQHSYSITAAPGPGCVVTWFINGQNVKAFPNTTVALHYAAPN